MGEFSFLLPVAIVGVVIAAVGFVAAYLERRD